jgi:hypothetical protein
MSTWRFSSDLYLKLNYHDNTVNNMKKFINRNNKAIYERIRILGLQKIPNWTDDEIQILLTESPTNASLILKRSYNSCLIKKSRLCKKNKQQTVPRT